MELGNVVRFASHPRPFLVEDDYCSNPDCSCNEVFLRFTEVDDRGRSLRNPLCFTAHVDLESWQESRPPRRAPEVASWVREFLEQCPSTRRGEFQASYEEARRLARRRAEYTIDANDVLEGALFSYANILTEKSALSAGGTAYTFNIRYQGREYLVEDRYCPNPDCDCQAVHLEFFEALSEPDGGLRIYQRFLGRVSFAGRLTVEKRIDCSLTEATAVLSACWKECGSELKMLQDRYQEVKAIGQRSLDAQPVRPFAGLPTATLPVTEEVSLDDRLGKVRVGRNAPCPCGSGKKYKKCCWRKAAVPL